MKDQLSSIGGSTSTTDDVLKQLRAHQQRSQHAPDNKDLSAWKAELEKSARNWEVVGKKFMSNAAELREKIRAIDILLGQDRNPAPNGSPSTTPPPVSSQTARMVQEFNPDAPPDLRHTRVLAARFAGQAATGWNKLVHMAHKEAMSRVGSLDVLRDATTSNFIVGRASSEETKKGYRYVPDIGISIQNVDAGHAWSNTLRLARYLHVEVRVDFEWMQKSDAAFPGEAGQLGWKPV